MNCPICGVENNNDNTKCSSCGNDLHKKTTITSQVVTEKLKFLMKKWWFWVIIACVVISIPSMCTAAISGELWDRSSRLSSSMEDSQSSSKWSFLTESSSTSIDISDESSAIESTSYESSFLESSKEVSSVAPQSSAAPVVNITGQSKYQFKRNQNATISIKGIPSKVHSISVYYNSGESKAKGLENKTADSNGNVSWTWKIGMNTKENETYRAVISCEGQTFEITFDVVD